MKKQIALILCFVLLLGLSLPLSHANAEDREIVNAIKPASGVTEGGSVREVRVTEDNWVDYFTIERAETWTDKDLGGMHHRSIGLDYRLVLREQYRDRLSPEETSELHFSYICQKSTGILLVDFTSETLVDTGRHAAASSYSGELTLRLTGPYAITDDSLLESCTVLCYSEDGEDFGTIIDSFEMQSVSGSLYLTGGETADDAAAEDDTERLIDSGVTGTVRWKLDQNGTFTVYGEGEMSSSVHYPPWEEYSDSIRSVIIEEGVRSVGHGAFSGCPNLRSVQLADSVTRIESCAFYYCPSLTAIRIPAAVEIIGERAFACDPLLEQIEVDPDSRSFTAEGIALYNREKSVLVCCSAAVEESFRVPETVIKIDEMAFYDIHSLKSVELPGTLEHVENGAFHYCDGLEKVIWNGTLQQWEELNIEGENEALTSAELIFTRMADRPSVGVMEPLVDDGRLQVLCRDSFLEITLSGLELDRDLILDRSETMGLMEYSWKVNFSDGKETYSVGSVYSVQNPGLNRVGSFDDTTARLTVETGPYQWASIDTELTVSRTDSSIHWSFEIPAEYSFDAAAVRSFQVEITDFAAGLHEFDTHYVQADPATLGQQDIGRGITLGAFEQDNLAANGREALNWVILDVEEDRALVLCSKCIDCRPWHEEYEDISWEDCSLRAWLNGEFLESAFTEEERGRILLTDWNNADDPKETADTRERISLLSLSEVRTYLKTERELLGEPTAYALGRGAEEITGGAGWWLRTSGTGYESTALIDWFADEEERGYSSRSDEFCVRPCFWLRIGD